MTIWAAGSFIGAYTPTKMDIFRDRYSLLYDLVNSPWVGLQTLNPFQSFDQDVSVCNLDGSMTTRGERESGVVMGVLPSALGVIGKMATSVAKGGKAAEIAAKGVTNAGEMLGNFGIPKLYTYTNGGKVSPHAMKHLEELAANGAKLGPDYLKLLGQTHQKALHSAIDDVLSQGAIQYRKMYYSGGNEIMFSAPRSAGELPAVIHFR